MELLINEKVNDNQQLSTQQIVHLLIKLGFKQEKIISHSQLTSKEFECNYINTVECFKNEIQKLNDYSSYEGIIIIFKVNSNNKYFNQNQNENNYHVALYFFEKNIYYIDSFGYDISSNLEDLIQEALNMKFRPKVISSKASFYNIKKNIEISQNNNDIDFAIFIPLAIYLISISFENKEKIYLQEEKSKEIRDILNEIINSINDEIICNAIQKIDLLLKLNIDIFLSLENLRNIYMLPLNYKKLISGTYQMSIAEIYKLEEKNYVESLNSLKKNILNKICYFDQQDDFFRSINNIESILIYYNVNKNLISEVMKDIDILFLKDQRNMTHMKRIKTFLKYKNIEIDEKDITINKQGKNESYIVKYNNKNYFIKTFGGSILNLKTSDEKINPKEPLLYKILEYMNFGPKTTFLITSLSKSYSSMEMSSKILKIPHGNYIMTEEVPYFLMDTIDNKENYEKFVNSKNINNAIEISVACILRDLFGLADTFPENPFNYGISKQNDEYDKFMFVDHIPTLNGYFSELNDDKIAQYSPRENMQIYTKDMPDGNFKDLSQSYNHWKKYSLAKQVNDRIFNFSNNKNNMSIYKAVEKAKIYVNELINNCRLNFTEYDGVNMSNDPDYSHNILNFYCDKILKRIEFYRETNYGKTI